MYELSKKRPTNYFALPSAEAYEIDKDLGILDWDGACGGGEYCGWGGCPDCKPERKDEKK